MHAVRAVCCGVRALAADERTVCVVYPPLCRQGSARRDADKLTRSDAHIVTGRRGCASTPAEIDAAFAAFGRERADALVIAGDGFFYSRRVQLATLAVRDRMPASYPSREMVEAGLLMSYGTIFPDMFRQVGIYTGSILKGAKPADLPVVQSAKFELVINAQTARMLGIDIPATLLARADEVIE